MARKDILKGLLNPEGDHSPPSMAMAMHPRSSKGAIGAVSRSIADLKARSVIEIDSRLIDGAGVQDRLGADDANDAELARSIAEYGQQVPVLVRPHPTEEGRFQIVYGRRRVAALRDLGLPIKALVRDLDDQQLVIAQGQENTARRDLSFIEKVNFARQMQESGYSRKVICDALSIDKTLISRMLSVAERIPFAVIAAIGSAHAVGRDRWTDLAQLISQCGFETSALLGAIGSAAEGTSEARFDSLYQHLTQPSLASEKNSSDRTKPSPDQPRSIETATGRLGDVRRIRDTLVLRLDVSATRGFEEWLVDELPRLHATWQSREKQ